VVLSAALTTLSTAQWEAAEAVRARVGMLLPTSGSCVPAGLCSGARARPR
jgi:hypothetical protein